MPTPLIETDLLVHASWIISVDDNNTVHSNASLAVHDGKIAGICSTDEAGQYFKAAQTIDLHGQILAPGLVNAHGHSAMSLLRGFADDLPLMEWLENHIWPAEGRFADAEFVEDGSRLAIAEMFASGTTCFSDMYFFPDATASLAQHYGMRSQIAFPVIEMETAWASHLDEYIDKGLRLVDEHKHSNFVDVCFGPHAPYTVSRDALERVAMLANETDNAVHIHVHETAAEVATFEAEFGMRPLAMLQEIGLTSPRLQCAHMCHADETDMEILADTGTHVIHCPKSNLKLASGFMPLQAMQEQGVNIALGTDGAASNNSLDMLSEMNIAALLAKAVSQRADAASAVDVVRHATINGAKALGRDNEIGSLEIGKQADFIAIDTNHAECWPMYEPVSHLVYSANRSHVSNVWTAGKRRLQDGKLTGMDITELRNKANYWRKKIQA